MTEQEIRAKAETWLSDKFDETTRQEVQQLLDNDPVALTDAFYTNLEFGTGGLRGIMGAGTNRINDYTIATATQGLCNYLLKMFPNEQVKIAIAHDSRNNSPRFAQKTADVCSANGIEVYLFEALRPTPELSFTIRQLGCHSGVVVTASHNPKEYNGYKVYWNDGGQLVPPHDKNVIKEVLAILGIEDVKMIKDSSKIHMIGQDLDEAYLDALKKLSLSPEATERQKDMKIVYTGLHGTGITMVPPVLKKFGFTNISTVAEQDEPNGNFPTVHSPNPEESAALELALQLAKEIGAELVMGTDPDSDRVGIAVRDLNNELILLNGNQTGVLLVYYLLRRWKELGKLDGNQFTAKTIVTSGLVETISKAYNVTCYNVLTGFKYIAELIRQFESEKQFIGGGEESYGYLAGDFVRDKDAILSCALIAEMAAWAKDNGKTLYELLIDIYVEFGFYKESLISVTRKGKQGAEEIAAMMEKFRNDPPKQIDNSPVVWAKDYKAQVAKNLTLRTEENTGLPQSNVLQFEAENGTVVTVRPSGTEPKIKFYFSVNGALTSKEEFDAMNNQLDERLRNLEKEITS